MEFPKHIRETGESDREGLQGSEAEQIHTQMWQTSQEMFQEMAKAHGTQLRRMDQKAT